MGSLVTRDMLLKHTALALAVFAAIADARRLRGGRKRGNRGRGKGKRPAAAAAAVSAEVDKIAFNPNRKYELKPNEETRKKYCQDITKMKNPWLHCKAVCGGRGRKKTMCIR